MHRNLSLILLAAAIAGPAAGETLATREHSRLPQPITNNAVAALDGPDGPALYSFNGLGAGRTWRDTRSSAFVYQPATRRWHVLADVPGPAGRLASTAVGVAGALYVFGGYTVAADHSEVSVPTLHRYEPADGRYRRLSDMPVPVDDAVSVVHRDRYVYLVSGWHNSGNVNLVQVYDIETDRWFQATPYPGEAVFGHAGGLVGTTMIVCDGVGVRVRDAAAREFAAVPACYRGVIRDDDPSRIDWFAIPHHSGTAYYRMAATGHAGRVVFAGGSANPYNYDGVGYDGRPSEPARRVFAWSVADAAWHELGDLGVATMDHRGLLVAGEELLIVGGMREGRSVANTVVAIRISAPP